MIHLSSTTSTRSIDNTWLPATKKMPSQLRVQPAVSLVKVLMLQVLTVTKKISRAYNRRRSMLQWLPLPTLTSRIPQLLTMDNTATPLVESARMKWSTSPHASSLNSRPTWVASMEALPSIRVSPLSRLLKLSSSRTTVSVSFSSNSALCLTTRMHAVDSLTIAPLTLSSRTWTSASDRSARSPLWSLYMTSKRLKISAAQTPRISPFTNFHKLLSYIKTKI